MPQQDLLFFDILLPHGGAVSEFSAERTASNWTDAVQQLWSVPKPRVIVARTAFRSVRTGSGTRQWRVAPKDFTCMGAPI